MAAIGSDGAEPNLSPYHEPVRVLVVEDETKMASLLRRALEREGYAVDVAGNGVGRGLAGHGERLRRRRPRRDAAAARRLRGLPDAPRERGRWAPVLLLTARDAVEDRVAGLDAGADDYLPKPFSFAELYARLRALTSRARDASVPATLRGRRPRLDPADARVSPRRAVRST